MQYQSKRSKMKQNLLLLFIFSILIWSCQDKQNEAYIKANENLNLMVGELTNKFPLSSSFHSIMFSFDELMGNTILLKIAGNADSSKIEEWLYMNGIWAGPSEILMETDSLKYAELFFSADTEYSFSRLNGILSAASEKIEIEKNIDLFAFKSINLLMAKQLFEKNKMENLITQVTIESVKDKKVFLLHFDANGNFVSMSEE